MIGNGRALHQAVLLNKRLTDCSLSGSVVRFADPTTRLAMVRTPREFCGRVRASITLLTLLNNQRVVLAVMSVNGSARTAKVAAIRELRRFYRDRILVAKRNGKDRKSQVMNAKDTVKHCRLMEDALERIATIDF